MESQLYLPPLQMGWMKVECASQGVQSEHLVFYILSSGLP